ncbi:MFS transporter [Hydrocarboniphaga sp.]|uniref:MFS transporter n=1 Tax=Hydrocarboniphaga sp. TaxID=2033016 RepID=UPI003D0EBAAA
MLALIVAGETVFVLPFVVARVLRTTFLSVFGLSNLQLGSAFSVYGIVAMLSYFLGGPLADRYAARVLISAALAATAAGGLLFATIPSITSLALLYGFWGMTSILLFWAALIRATRVWGGDASQGRAYGILDGGRGLLAALLASATVVLFAHLLPADVASATPLQRRAALQEIILICSAFTLLAALLAWWILPPRALRAADDLAASIKGIRVAAKLPGVWLQALIIVSAYVAYKATDNFGLYAHDVLGFDEVAAARLGTISFWTRPFAALLTGLLADRISGSRALIVGFAVLATGALVLALDLLPMSVPTLLIATVITTSLGIYGVRGVYYAVMGEARVPLSVTGSAVGLVSVIGYTPDVFAGALFGWLLDRDPGAAGHHHVFLTVAGFAVIGILASIGLRLLSPLPPGEGGPKGRVRASPAQGGLISERPSPLTPLPEGEGNPGPAGRLLSEAMRATRMPA